MNDRPLLSYDVVAERGATPTRTGMFVHGILGAGRNWRSFARRLAQAHPEWRFLLPDLRNHGDSPGQSAPHTVAAAAGDLARLAEAEGAPEVVIGHSFGGKVALALARDGLVPKLRHVVVLDAPPGRASGPLTPELHDALGVLEAVRSVPMPATSREDIRSHLRSRGLSEPVIAWLLTSTRHEGGGWRWKYDLQGVHEMITDYFRLDLWPFLEHLPDGLTVTVVRAGRSDRWTAEELARFEGVRALDLEVLPNAGHWLHVDDPEGLLALLEPHLAR